MRVIGIDPGSTATGWAVVARVRGRFQLEDAGVIRTRSDQPMGHRLAKIHGGLTAELGRLQPEGAAIEQVFKHRSAESALRLGQARGVALLALAQHGLDIGEYNPSTIKKSVAGHGRAGKKEIQLLVQRLLGLDAPLASDAADAAAIAMTHLARHGLVSRLQALPTAGQARHR